MVVSRIVNELQVRGYRTWFGAHDHQLAKLSLTRRAVVLATVLNPCVLYALQTWTT
jgi:hypothetical protein